MVDIYQGIISVVTDASGTYLQGCDFGDDGVFVDISFTVSDLQVGSDKAVYFGDESTNGTWRFIRSGNTLLVDRRESAAWNTKAVIDEDGQLLSQGAFAEIYVHDSSAAVTVATGAAYVLMTQWAVNGQSANCTPDQANDKITITKKGRYLVTGSISFTTDTNNVTCLGVVYLNGVEQDQIHFRRKVGTAGDEGAAAVCGLIDVTSVPWDVDFRMRHDDAGSVDITITYADLSVVYLGET